ncbi:hypothetical protein BU17DRAFT_64393 [Hysterangium stoloniferum]|nr:hypothetical protein BU17DRAFT_64393 [Hysterangium stoloniferum]
MNGNEYGKWRSLLMKPPTPMTTEINTTLTSATRAAATPSSYKPPNSSSKSFPISSPSKHTITTTTTITTTSTKPTTAARSPTITPKAAIQFELELGYDDDRNDYLHARKQPIIAITTSFTHTGKGQSRGRKSMPGTLRFASAEEAARLYRARSTPSLSLSMSLEGGDDRPSPEPQARGRDASLERDVARMSPVGSMFCKEEEAEAQGWQAVERMVWLLRGWGGAIGLFGHGHGDENSRECKCRYHDIVAAEAETAVVVIVVFVRVELPSAYLSPFTEKVAFTPTPPSTIPPPTLTIPHSPEKAAYPHAKTHPHVWVDARDRDRGGPGRDEQTCSDSGSGSGVGGRLDPGAGAGVGLSVDREAGTATSGGFSVGQMSMRTGISFPRSASAPSPPSPPSATAPANAPIAAPAKQAQAPAAQAQAQMARVASPTPTPHIARVSSPMARIASPTPSFLPSYKYTPRAAGYDGMFGWTLSHADMLWDRGPVWEDRCCGISLNVMRRGSERHEHVEAEASTAMVNEDGHGHGVLRLQKPPVGLSVRLKMRMQTKANLNVDVAQSPTVPEYPYTFPRVPPSPSCPASNPPAAWAGGAMSIVQTMDGNGHLQAHIHDHDTGKDPTIAQNDDNTHGDGGGGGMNMKESMESAQKPPRSPLFDAGDPFRREGRGPQTQTQIRARMRTCKYYHDAFPVSGSGSAGAVVNPAMRQTSLPSASSAGLGTDPNETARAKGVTMRTLSAGSQSPGGLKALLLGIGWVVVLVRVQISILPSPSGPGRVLPAPAPRPPSKALPPLPHLRASVVGGGGSGNASGETLKSTGSVSSLGNQVNELPKRQLGLKRVFVMV